MKLTYHLGARALAMLLKAARMMTFTLWKVQDLSPMLHEWYGSMRNCFGAHTRFLRWCADVKEMYTGVPHAEAIRAIEFVVARMIAATRYSRCFVRVEKRLHGAVEFGRANHLLPGYTTLSFSEIRTICCVDVLHCYFQSLGVILHQDLGFPMGSPGAPNLAICLCS